MKPTPYQFDGIDSGWRSLTATEEFVAEAVSQGLTNREVGKRLLMSHHTVDAHLRHIYWKLGINSRNHLTRLFVERTYDGLKATA